MFVIARNSSFTYKGKATKVQDVAEQLGVRYVIEGSVQRTGDRIRVTAQLIDAIDGKHIWAERYDRELTDLFKVQDEITSKIFVEVGVKLTVGDIARWTREISSNLDSYRLVSQGREHFQTWSKKGHKAAWKMYSKIAKRHPDTSIANRMMGWLHWQKLVLRISKDRKKDRTLARKYAEKSLSIMPNPGAYLLLASLDVYASKHESVIANIDRALELAPAHGSAHTIGGWAKLSSGQPAEGVRLMKLGMRLEPVYPTFVAYNLAYAYMELGKYDDAKRIAEGLLASKNVKDVKAHPIALRQMTAIEVFQGNLSGARDYANRLLELKPKFSIARFKPKVAHRKSQEFWTRFFAALRKAGLPENPPLKLPDKPSIAVLPFDNLTGDSAQEYLADGLTETITAALATIPEMFVIARNSSFTYKGKAVKVKQVAKELGVRYVLEGSIQRSGETHRITAQLIDAVDGKHLWSGRYDRKAADLFAVQDEITLQIVSSLQVELTEGERARLDIGSKLDLRAWGNYVKGRALFLRFTKPDNAQAQKLALQALDWDPRFVWAWRMLGYTHAVDAQRSWGASNADSMRLAKEAADKAFALNPNDSQVHGLLGKIHLLDGKHEEAIAEGRKAIELAPNIADNYSVLAMYTRYAGEFRETVALTKKAMRLHPHHPAWYLYGAGVAHMMLGEHDKAVSILKSYRDRNPTAYRAKLSLAMAYSMAGQMEKAREQISLALAEKPSFTLKDVAKIHRFKNPEHLSRILDALRKAGVPD